MLEVVRYYWDCFESGAIYKKSRPKDQVALSGEPRRSQIKGFEKHGEGVDPAPF